MTLMKTGLVLIRIDDRLIHGQVVQAWVRYTGADCIVVVSDEVAVDSLQKDIMELAVPPPLKVQFLEVEEAAVRIAAGEFKNRKAIMLFANPQDLLRAVEGGLNPSKVNVGGLHYLRGKRLLTSEVALSREEIEAFRLLINKGINLEVRAVPSDKSQDLQMILR